MALTEEQKAGVRKRRDELVASGSTLSEATRIAFDEVAGPGEFQKRLEQKKATPVVDLAQTKKETESRALQTSLVQAEQDWVRSRRDELKRSGYGEAEAASQAQKEFNESFGKPPAAGFGTYEERSESYIDPTAGIAKDLSKSYLPEIYGATFGRRTFRPEDSGLARIEEERFLLPGAKPFQTSAIPSGFTPDFNALKDIIKKDGNLSEEQASSYVNGLRAAYEVALKEEEAAATRVAQLPELPAVLKPSTDVEGISKRALEKALKEVSEIDSVKLIQPEKARSEEIRKTKGTTLEQLGAALGRQEEAGKGVPDYSDTQIAFLKSEVNREKEAKIQERIAQKPEKVSYEYTKDGKTVVLDKAEYDARIAIPDDPIQTVKVKEIKVPLTEGEIRAEVEKEYALPWYLDPAKKKRYLANPEKYVKEGTFTDTNIYGGQRETVTGQLLRGALSIPNAVAGLVSPMLFEGFGETGEAIAEEKRRRRPELYKDSPVLYNIAENRGFFGEGQEVADILELEGPLRYAYLAGTFAADVIDPSLDAVVAAGKGLKVSRQAAAASKAIGALGGKTSNAALASKVAANELLDSSFLSVLTGKRFDTVNPRAVATGNLVASLEDSTKVADSIKANPSITAADAAASLGDTGYGKLFKSSADANTTRPASEVWSELASSDGLLKTADEIGKGLDEVVQSGSTRLIRSKELARQLGALASSDPAVSDIFKGIDRSPKAGVQKIAQYVQGLSPDQLARLKKGLLFDAASTAVIKATSNMSALDNIVAVTKNTFVNKSSVKEIMEKAAASDIGKISKALKDAKIVFKGGEKGVNQAFEVSGNIGSDIIAVAEGLVDFRKLDNISLDRIKRTLNSGYIFTYDLRSLIDANVDLIAEGTILAGKDVVRARDVARLPIIKQQDLLVPLESRAFTREVLKEWLTILTSRFTRSPSKLSIGQQRLLSEATSRAASLDIKLRTAIQDLTGKGLEDIKSAYGIAPDAALSRSQALAYSIVGPLASRKPENIKDVLDFALRNLFYSKTLKQDIFNLFRGVDISRDTSTLTRNGEVYFDALTERAAARIAAAPETFWQELISLSDKYREILSSARRSPQVAQDFFSVKPSEIVDIAAEGSERISSKFGDIVRKVPGGTYAAGTKKAIPSEISVALYYKAEADRIQKELLNDLISKEIGKGQITLESTIKEDYFNFIKSVEDRLGLKILDAYPKIISNRLEEILTNPTWKTTPISEADIATMFPNLSSITFYSPQYLRNIPMTPREIMKDTDFMSALSVIVERAEDIALGIMRQNGLSNVASIKAIEDAVESIVKGEGGIDAQLKLLFGEDVAGQVKKNLEDGFSSLKEDLQNQLIRSYEGRGPLTAVADSISTLFEKINDFRYTFLLNFRPRFHGANLATAADIYYSTTGKLPNYIDATKGLALTDISRRDPSRIILQSADGSRIYTAREVYDLLSTMGGKSVYTLTAPNLANKRVLELTDDDFRIFGDWWNSFANLPTIEDMAFRYSVFADAIRSGRSEDEALELARKSMFDAADITDLERPIQKLLMFYGFARNNFVNFAKNMASPEGQKRIIKFLKTERNFNNLNTSEEDREFAPGYTQTKTIFGKLPISPEKDLYLTSSPWATKEAVKLFGELVKGNFGEVLSGMVNPTFKEILGISGEMDRDPNKISPEHIALMSLVPFSTPGDIASFIAGSQITPRVARPEDGAVDGYIYPLTTPEQIKRYKAFIDLLSYSGLAAPITDWSRNFFGEGTPVGALNAGGKTAYALGMMTPSYGIPAWKQDYFNKLSKLQAIKASAAKIEKEVAKETSVVSAGIPQTPEAAELEKAVTQGRAEKTEASSKQARIKQLKSELDAAKPPKTGILERYNYNVERMQKEYIQPRREELDRLLGEGQPKPSTSTEGRPTGGRPPSGRPPAGRPPAGSRPPGR